MGSLTFNIWTCKAVQVLNLNMLLTSSLVPQIDGRMTSSQRLGTSETFQMLNREQQ